MNALTQLKVKTIVRLNDPLYDKTYFTSKGFAHFDLVFPDGSVPSQVS